MLKCSAVKDDIDARHLAGQLGPIANIGNEEAGTLVMQVLLIKEKYLAFVIVDTNNFTGRMVWIGKQLPDQFRTNSATGTRNKNRLALKILGHVLNPIYYSKNRRRSFSTPHQVSLWAASLNECRPLLCRNSYVEHHPSGFPR